VSLGAPLPRCSDRPGAHLPHLFSGVRTGAEALASRLVARASSRWVRLGCTALRPGHCERGGLAVTQEGIQAHANYPGGVSRHSRSNGLARLALSNCSRRHPGSTRQWKRGIPIRVGSRTSTNPGSARRKCGPAPAVRPPPAPHAQATRVDRCRICGGAQGRLARPGRAVKSSGVQAPRLPIRVRNTGPGRGAWGSAEPPACV
jgi:hypothetical protein